jgi:hypothetical protein
VLCRALSIHFGRSTGVSGRSLGVNWRTFAVSRGHCRLVKNVAIIGLSRDFFCSPNCYLMEPSCNMDPHSCETLLIVTGFASIWPYRSVWEIAMRLGR